MRLSIWTLLPAVISIAHAKQIPMGPSIEKLRVPQDQSPFVAESGTPSLHDLLSIQTRASIFGDYLRSTGLSGQLQDSNAKLTLLVPTNKAVIALPMKPHQRPRTKSRWSGSIEITEEQKDRLSQQNVLDWVNAHIIPKSISLSSGETFRTLNDGVSVKFVEKSGATSGEEWERYVLSPDVNIVSRIDASNGVLYLIDGTVPV